MGVIPVVYRIGGTPQAVISGQTGFVVPLGNRAQLQARVVELLESGSLRQRMVSAARAFVEERFTLSALAERHERYYADALAQRETGAGDVRDNSP
jgi:glycosyltransferase involved in cell wall biosynthesis